jgi:hypothetical protein
MVTVTTDDLRRVEQVEHELATHGREPERAAVHKALTLLRRAAVEALEEAAGIDNSTSGILPAEGSAPVRTLTPEQEGRLAALQAVGTHRRASAGERRELQTLLDVAEEGAMRNVLGLLREYAPDSEQYERALRAYRRSFARFRPTSRPAARAHLRPSEEHRSC